MEENIRGKKFIHIKITSFGKVSSPKILNASSFSRTLEYFKYYSNLRSIGNLKSSETLKAL